MHACVEVDLTASQKCFSLVVALVESLSDHNPVVSPQSDGISTSSALKSSRSTV